MNAMEIIPACSTPTSCVDTMVITGKTNAQAAWPAVFQMKSRVVRWGAYSASAAERPSPFMAPTTRSNQRFTKRAMKFCL